MLRHSGGQKVGKGTYWNIKEGTRVDVEREDVLPGNEKTNYLRMPAVVMLVAGPFLGLLYVIALPFIAIGTVAALGGSKLIGSFFGWLKSIATFGWKPTEAYLSGKKKRKKEKS